MTDQNRRAGDPAEPAVKLRNLATVREILALSRVKPENYAKTAAKVAWFVVAVTILVTMTMLGV